MPEMKPVQHGLCMYWIQYLTVCVILDLEAHISKQIEQAFYPSAGEAWETQVQIVSWRSQMQKHLAMCGMQNNVLFMGLISGIQSY